MSDVTRSLVKCRFAANVAFNMLTKFLSRIVPRKKMTVVIEQGTLEGQYYKTKISNKPYVRFLGVPYAKPPINDLRFKPPEKHPGWSGVLHANSEGNVCLQYDMLITKKIIGSEDCLYLNVFVPQEESNEKKAVMVFIHGGAFNIGSATPDLYSPDYLIDENVIVVTINYRLNVLGFLNLGIDECPGNMGLKDQLFALKWVKSNISAFGGDANNITIFGESAGSASVHCHTLSPEATGSFKKAIMQSGCIFNAWAMHEKHEEVAITFAKKMGCQQDNPKEIVQYLRNVPAINLVESTKMDDKSRGDDEDFMYFEFVPSVESKAVTNPFLPDHPEILVKTASHVPVIIGINNMEGMVAFGEERLGKITELYKIEEIRKLLKDITDNEELIDKVKHFYFNENDPECEKNRLDNICHLITDVFFIKDIINRGLNHLLKHSNDIPVYNYEFKFDGGINVLKKLLFATRPKFLSLKGACHGDELSYIFYSQLLGFSPKANSPESRMCKTICKLWTNFAKNGNPNSPDLNFEWNSTSVDKPKYLSFDGDNTKMVDGLLYSSRVNFWKNFTLDRV